MGLSGAVSTTACCFRLMAGGDLGRGVADRERDGVLGLSAITGDALADARRGRNGRHALVGRVRHSVSGGLAVADDVNAAGRLRQDPAMRWIGGGKASHGCAASASQMGRFEPHWLTVVKKLSALGCDPSGQWIDRVHGRRPPRGLVRDMDTSVSPTHGEQAMSVWNGQEACVRDHPLFVFNQSGDLERCALCPGNVHSADGWKGVLDRVMARYRGKLARIIVRAEAGFANPDVDAYPEAEGIRDAIRLPAIPCGLHRSGRKLAKAAQGRRQGRGHPGKPCPRVGFIVTKMTRPAENVVGSCTKHGTCEQWIKDGKGAITWTRLACRSLACNAVRLQLHALACNPGNVLRTLATPEPIADGSMTTRRKTLIMARRLLAMRALSRSRSPGSRFRRTCLRRCFK